MVISIIGILSSVLYASFNEARDDSRNKAMQAELKEVQLALELYKAQNGKYPAPKDTGAANCKTTMGVATAKASACGTDEIIVGLVPDYIADLPKRSESGNTACDISYKTDTLNSWYKLTAENCVAGVTAATGVQVGDEYARCVTSTACSLTCTAGYVLTAPFYESYAVYSAGGECRL